MLVTEAELFLAYRQAKNALAEERVGLGRLDMAATERNLPTVLQSLREQLTRSPGWFSGVPLGRLWLVPKKASPEPNREGVTRVGGEYLIRLTELSVRTHLVPSVEFATVELLWLREFGAALESLLTPAARGNRLKLRDRRRDFDRDARVCFEFWPEAYRAFREEGFALARQMLKRGRQACLIATFDLASYYDEIDPGFLLEKKFVADVAARSAGSSIQFAVDDYLVATRTLVAAFSRYRTACRRLTGVPPDRGIPIGCLTSKLIANLALSQLDDYVLRQRNVRYYARYVDDILLVADAPKGPRLTPRSIVRTFLPMAPRRTRPKGGADLLLDSVVLERPGSRFRVQPAKLRGYVLRGQRGTDFLDTVQRDVRMIASERRAFLEPDGLGSTSPLAALFVGADDHAPVQVLRDVDRLKVERYAASVAISKVAVGVELLDNADAQRWCRDQLGPLVATMTGPEEAFQFLDLAFRALSVAIRANDATTSLSILRRHGIRWRRFQARRPQRGIRWNGRLLKWERASKALRAWYEQRRLEEICASVRLADVQSVGATDYLRTLFGRGLIDTDAAEISAQANLLLEADLRTVDRETDLQRLLESPPPTAPPDWSSIDATLRNDPLTAERYLSCAAFLETCSYLQDAVYTGMAVARFLLMTKPPTQFDIATRWARARRSPNELPHVTNAVRGTRYADATVRTLTQHDIDIRSLEWFVEPHPRNVRVVLGNLVTADEWWAAAARGTPTVPKRRMMAVGRIVNEAIRLKTRTKNETLLVLPELSLPRALVRALVRRLLGENISLVAGIEYRREGTDQVVNEALGAFAAGYRGVAVCWWPKSLPAREEELRLIRLKLRFVSHKDTPITVHTDFGSVSTLICSELLDVSQRASLRGRIDLLVVPAWNKDTATFDHTIQTTANDLHAFVAVGNNGQFSDCRVQVPSDERYLRDAVRLICREEDVTTSVLLSPRQLREFQKKSLTAPRRRPKGFKPLPPGYEFKRK